MSDFLLFCGAILGLTALTCVVVLMIGWAANVLWSAHRTFVREVLEAVEKFLDDQKGGGDG